MKLRLSQEGADPSHSSSKDYAQYIRSEFNRWSGVFKKGGITLSE
jgi:tripartite-type tricarboxylate transporter receptor subunit TctC